MPPWGHCELMATSEPTQKNHKQSFRFPWLRRLKEQILESNKPWQLLNLFIPKQAGHLPQGFLC